jgi:hypothetical protein
MGLAALLQITVAQSGSKSGSRLALALNTCLANPPLRSTRSVVFGIVALWRRSGLQGPQIPAGP